MPRHLQGNDTETPANADQYAALQFPPSFFAQLYARSDMQTPNVKIMSISTPAGA